MGLYNVVKPCVVGDLHYARPTAAPIEVSDKLAVPLVTAGQLEPVGANAEPVGDADDDGPATQRVTRRRRSVDAEDGE